MNRKHRTVGPALLLALAAISMSASTAHAEEFMAEEYPATLTAEQKKHPNITLGGLKVTCKKSMFKMTLLAPSNVAKSVDHYSECSVKIGAVTYPATVTTNDCYQLYHLTPRRWTLICNVGLTELHIYSNAEAHAKDESFCKFSISTQEELQTVDYENVKEAEPEDILIKREITGIVYEAEGFLCELGGEDGEITSEATITAENEEEQPIGLWIE